jgi:ubiquinone/menaquinone biosynthesis C-methylase UbiE
MDDENPLLQRAVSLGGDKGKITEFYDDWAADYDRDLIETIGYVAPQITAEALAGRVTATAQVLDAGCGTGLVGVELHERKPGLVIDGIDLTPGMMAEARNKGMYRDLVEADMTATLPFADNTYDGVVCAGVFTNGHVGPEGLYELVRIAKPGAPIVLTVRDSAWESDGFKDTIADLEKRGLIRISEITHSPYHGKEGIFCQLCVLEAA